MSGYGIKERHLLIFDRWGQLLFRSDDPLTGWNGYYNGRPCEEGAYVYKLQFNTLKGIHEERSGIVNLLR